ncbi:MAG: NADH-quinone oxidoreductase subunit M [Bernardetiaceae bacterium]|nr:NADH-quinone oxidoreductase subunit M [Bernardetiaceae bacterium]
MWLSLLILIPLLGLLVVAILPRGNTPRYVLLGATGLNAFIGSLLFFYSRIGDKTELLFEENYDWLFMELGGLGKISVSYHLGIDGLNAALILLAVWILFLGAWASWSVRKKLRAYVALYLILSASVMGCFVALDFILFFLCFEFMLLPMYFLIGIWGGRRREYAAVKFFIYTLVGSVLILIGGIALQRSVLNTNRMAIEAGTTQIEVQEDLQAGKISSSAYIYSFDMPSMQNPNNYPPESSLYPQQNSTPKPMRYWVFAAILVGFLIKMPIVPLHTWLPSAHVEASTPISMVLAGILLKIGGYGLMRLGYTVFPDIACELATWISALAVVAIIYGAFVALGQTHLKRLIAYSSISHMGFVLLGLASLTQVGFEGAIYQMFSHGFISALLFFMAGALQKRTGSLVMADYSGMAMQLPRWSFFVAAGFFAALGLPMFSGFIAELLIFMGAFASDYVPLWIAITAFAGLILGGAYAMRVVALMLLGKPWQNPKLSPQGKIDLSRRELTIASILLLFILLAGIYPKLLTESFGQTLGAFGL